MKPLFDILKGDPDPTSPRTLTLEGRQALDKVEQALSKQQATYCDYTQEWGLYILPTKHAPTAVFFVVVVLQFYFIFKLSIIVLVLPNTKMNPPQVYMCSPS